MKTNKKIILTFTIIIIIFFICSIASIYNFSYSYIENYKELMYKQIVFYLIGIVLVILLYKTNIKKLLKISPYIYIATNIILLLVLIFGTPINGAKAWFNIPIIGSIQPSEFAKVGIVLYIAYILDKTKTKTLKDEFKLILKVFIIVLIPSILTFLEPDTGSVIMYFISALIMLFVYGIKIRWFIFTLLMLSIIIGTILLLFYFKKELFIKIFGSSMFYRLDRLFNWSNSSGMQLSNSIYSIGGTNFFGSGNNNIKLYFPEGHTDFIFTSFFTCFGFFGSIILILTIIVFDFTIIKIAEIKKGIYKYLISGFIGIFIYCQIQNIAMTIGLLPITGITLPFISYGGSSLLSSFIILGIIISSTKKDSKYS